MAYSGDVSRGSAPAVRTLDHLTITKVSVGPMDNNAYLLRCGDDQLLIDAANDDDTLLALIGETGLATVVTTHRHGDHWQALAEVVAATGARTAAGRPDAEALPVPVDVPLDDGDRVQVGEVELEVIALVGHTPGSVALLYDDPGGHPHLITGDSLFPGGVGRTTNPADFSSLIDDVIVLRRASSSVTDRPQTVPSRSSHCSWASTLPKRWPKSA